MREIKILVVDDDPKVLEVYRLMFSGESGPSFGGNRPSDVALRCLAYTDPREMIQDYARMHARWERVPLCIVDMRMPKQSGLVTAEQLRTIDPEIDIVISSAYSDVGTPEIRERLRERVYFVRKPFDYEEISLMVESLVNSWGERRKLQRRSKVLRRRAESMRRQTAFLNSLLESVPELIFMKDTHGVYMMCNDAFARFAQHRVGEIVGGRDCDFLPVEMCQRLLEQDRQVMETGRSLNYKQRLEHPDGGECLLETVKSPVFSKGGQCIGLIGIARDITNREKAG
jgi:PAS domain S-box-containing protein